MPTDNRSQSGQYNQGEKRSSSEQRDQNERRNPNEMPGQQYPGKFGHEHSPDPGKKSGEQHGQRGSQNGSIKR